MPVKPDANPSVAHGITVARNKRSSLFCLNVSDEKNKVLRNYNQVLLSMLVLSCVLFAVPWTTSKFGNVTVYGVIGGTVAILLIRKLEKWNETSAAKTIF